MENKTFNLVNWEEGMSLSPDCFEMTENYFINGQCLGQEIHITNFNYGLLRPLRNNQQLMCEIEVSHSVTDSIEVRLVRCHGITTGGIHHQL